VLSLTSAKVGCPAFALASTMYFPMYPVPPITKILLLSAIQRQALAETKMDGAGGVSRAESCVYLGGLVPLIESTTYPDVTYPG
jgi:hypothetical protein